MQTKYIVVTGGVLSGLGKGIASASIGKILSSNHKVIPLKLDGYLNVDPGTMNPIEHGEVFVLDDGGEVDMDFGHYERFMDVKCKFSWNLTMGKVFEAIRKKERKGEYLGQTVQLIPHVVTYIKEYIIEMGKEENAEIVLIEVGGTVGDMENELYIEACRQLRNEVGKDNVVYVHLTYVPIPPGVNEQKSKPTQQSVALLRERGIQPNIIIGRCSEPLDPKIKRKIASFCDVEPEAVITGLDVDNVYNIPFVLNEEGLTKILAQELGIKIAHGVKDWQELLTRPRNGRVNIAICGKYTALEDSYASVVEAINHAAAHNGVIARVHWVETTDIENGTISVEDALADIDGVIVPGGFGSRGIEGKISIVRHCREKKLPYLGLCYGMQLAVIEYARNVRGFADANSSEIDPTTTHPVIDLLPEQKGVTDKGATMRLGGHDVLIDEGTRAHAMFGDTARLRFRHRYEVNPAYISELEGDGLRFSGRNTDARIMQILEMDGHPFFMGTQAHPELTSSLTRPNPFFFEFIKAAAAHEEMHEIAARND